MRQYRNKLHPSSCFPPNPPVFNTKNHLCIRIASNQTRHKNVRLTFVGVNTSTYSAIAALLASRIAGLIECINLFDICPKTEVHTNLHDLQLIGLFNKTNAHLRWTQSYWETKDSSIIIINVQHYRLENESLSAWTQTNASLIEDIISQVCIYSPRAILIICTQPNELMTYVAWRVSRFPSERILGLGASVDTAYAHRTILEKMKNLHGQINGYFVIGNEITSDLCEPVFTDHLTINGIQCSNIYEKTSFNRTEEKTIERQSKSKRRQSKEWDIIKMLKNKETIYTNISRKLPITHRQPIIKHFLSNSSASCSKSEPPPPPPPPPPSPVINSSFSTKPRSNWTEGLLITRIIQALITDSEFQSNFTVNIAPIAKSKDIFLNYPTIIGSTNGAIKYMFPIPRIQQLIEDHSFQILYEKLQSRLDFYQIKRLA